MNRYDFSPLFSSSVGFDRLARLMDANLATRDKAPGYPPYDIAVVNEDRYRITMAVAGYRESQLTIEVEDQTLRVTGVREKTEEDVEYLYRGIADSNFTRVFQLAEYVQVKGANLSDGLLTIDLERLVPEEMKPRTIEIETGAPQSLTAKAKKLLEGKKAA